MAIRKRIHGLWHCCKNSLGYPISMFKKFRDALADTGKLALTNYLLQSIFLSIFFYGYGMGYYGRIGHFRLYFLVAEVCLVQIVFSVMWMRYFNIGPANGFYDHLCIKRKFHSAEKQKMLVSRNGTKIKHSDLKNIYYGIRQYPVSGSNTAEIPRREYHYSVK